MPSRHPEKEAQHHGITVTDTMASSYSSRFELKNYQLIFSTFIIQNRGISTGFKGRVFFLILHFPKKFFLVGIFSGSISKIFHKKESFTPNTLPGDATVKDTGPLALSVEQLFIAPCPCHWLRIMPC
jgi:hypothetical protein